MRRRNDAIVESYTALEPVADLIVVNFPRRRLPQLALCPTCSLPLRDHPRCPGCGRARGHRATDLPDGLCGACVESSPPIIDSEPVDGWASLAVAVLRTILSSHRPTWFTRPHNAAWVRFWCDIAGLDPTLFFDRVNQYAGRKRRIPRTVAGEPEFTPGAA